MICPDNVRITWASGANGAKARASHLLLRFLAPNRRPRLRQDTIKWNFIKCIWRPPVYIYLAVCIHTASVTSISVHPASPVCTYHRHVPRPGMVSRINVAPPDTRNSFFTVTRSINFGFNAIEPEIRFRGTKNRFTAYLRTVPLVSHWLWSMGWGRIENFARTIERKWHDWLMIYDRSIIGKDWIVELQHRG